MTKQGLTKSQKEKFLPILIKRQDGLNCYQCVSQLDGDNYIFEHLNDNIFDNRRENIGLACQSCNVKKIKNAWTKRAK